MSITDKLNTIAENEQKVFEAGKTKQEYDWWNTYQNGNSGGMAYAIALFAGHHWNNATFKPKFDICPTNYAQYMFFYNNVIDLDATIQSLGIKFDTSKAKNMGSFFQNYLGKVIPEIDTTNCQTWDSLMFAYASALTTIKKLIVKTNGTQSFTNWFVDCSKLANIVIDGVIGRNIDFSACPLTKDSILSVVEHLSDTEANRTVTFKKTAKESAFTTDEWATLIATKPNWTFSLA